MIIKVKKTDNLILPSKVHEEDAGYDITATSMNIVGKKIDDGMWSSIDYIEYGTGLFIEPKRNFAADFHGGSPYYHVDLRPRSSISKYNLAVANPPPTIDRNYRGEIKVRFIYLWQPEDFIIHFGKIAGTINENKIYKVGDKIIQLLPCETIEAKFEIVDELSDTERGEGGFGSTGTLERYSLYWLTKRD